MDFFSHGFPASQKIRAGIVQDPQQQERDRIAREQERERVRERENAARRDQQERERINARVRELEEEIRQRDRIARDQERERENAARRDQQERARINARVRELEEEILQRDRIARETIDQKNKEISKINQNVQQLTGEIEYLKEQLTTEKKKNSPQENNGTPIHSNIPKQIKEIFKNDKIPIFKRYEKQPSELLNEFKNNKESKSIIAQHLEDLMIQGKISIGCSDCLLWPDILDYVAMICEVEKLVADKLEKQVKEDYEDFSEWNDDLDAVKLTLIFNVFGLSPEIIQKLGPEVDGTDFDQDIFDLCSTYGIDDWDTILDLGYIQMMLRSSNLPCRNHFETCTVCCCSTPKDLENLMKEHNLEFDFTLLERKNINGPRFIANTLWVKNCEEKIDQKQLRKAFRAVKKLHKIDDY